jgi:uncharacterized damage-inducible protein DinB
MTEDLRFPIGKFERPARLTPEERTVAITAIRELPQRFRAALSGLGADQVETPYRPGGWTVRQLAHHVPDSHMNAYIRFKLALTEEKPRIKPYREALWAELADTRETPIEVSLGLLDALHERWSMILRSMAAEDFARPLDHPELGEISLDSLLALYSWHGRHHTAHIVRLREREGW